MKVKLFQVRLDEKFIQSDQMELNNFLETVTVRRSAIELIQSIPKYWSVLLIYLDGLDTKKGKDHEKINLIPAVKSDVIVAVQEKNENSVSITTLNEIELTRLESLKIWRNEAAVRLNIPGYMVTSNATLVNIAKFNPQNVESLINIKGLGPSKVQRFGSDILALLNSV